MKETGERRCDEAKNSTLENRDFEASQISFSTMDGFPGKRISIMPKIKRFDAIASPINTHMDNHLVIGGTDLYHSPLNTKSLTIDPNGEKLDLSSPIIRYFCSRSPVPGKHPLVGESFTSPGIDATTKYCSAFLHQYSSNSSGSGGFGSRGGGSSASPLSALENFDTPPIRSPPFYGSPVKVDEEVLVMDGILVESLPGRNMRSASDSSGSSTGGSLSSLGKNLYKTEICLSWEDSGSCRYGSNCQFAHGKEELRPTRLSTNKIGKPYNNNMSKSRLGQQIMPVAAQKNSLKPKQTMRESWTNQIEFPPLHKQTSFTLFPAMTTPDWSPEDDGIIDLRLPPLNDGTSSSREDVNRYINLALYGGSASKMLPLFKEIVRSE